MSKPLNQSDRNARRWPRGFTLVELLVVMSIIALLSTVVLVALSGAQERARESSTRAQIAKIDAVLAAHWEGYQTRRVPINPQSGETIPQARLAALRELIRMELPDRISDVNETPVRLSARPALNRAYKLRADSNGFWGVLSNNGNLSYQGAECLYLILQNIRVDGGSAIEMFHPREIGDVDNDQMPEILDGWGRPIEFVRWAPGFRSPVQTGQTGPGLDPFDPNDAYSTGSSMLLYPLIYSAGPDGQYEINFGPGISYRSTTPPNDPFFVGDDGQAGSYVDTNEDGVDGSLDNITNHAISTRARP